MPLKWISIDERYPDNGQTVKIGYAEKGDFIEKTAIAIFKDTEDYRSWALTAEEQEKWGTLKPTHWMAT